MQVGLGWLRLFGDTFNLSPMALAHAMKVGLVDCGLH